MAGHKQPGPLVRSALVLNTPEAISGRYGYRGPEHHRRPRWKCVSRG